MVTKVSGSTGITYPDGRIATSAPANFVQVEEPNPDLVTPYSTWDSLGDGLIKRRNAANTGWVSEGALLSGLKGIASTLEAQALTADDVVITPKKLAAVLGGGSLTPNGYVVFPVVIAGERKEVIIQWAIISVAANTSALLSFPIAFPTACLAIVGSRRADGSNATFNFSIASETQLRAQNAASGTETGHYIAIGY